MCQSPRPIACLALALSLAVLLPGCLIGSSSETEHSGRYISEQTMSEVQPGASKDFVLAVYGEPTERVSDDETTELWRWSYRQTTNSSGSVFLIVSSHKKTEAEGAVWVKFVDGAVVRTWRDKPPTAR